MFKDYIQCGGCKFSKSAIEYVERVTAAAVLLVIVVADVPSVLPSNIETTGSKYPCIN